MCSDGFYCQDVFTCSVCGGHLQAKRFKSFANSYEHNSNDIITYVVLKSNTLKNLRDGLDDCLNFLNKLRDLKHRKKMGDFYSRLEVSFTLNHLGFNPHINIIFFGNFDIIIPFLNEFNLSIWKQKKDNIKETILSIVWYILKFNNIGFNEGKAVKVALNKKRVVLHSNRFNEVKKDDLIDEIINHNFYQYSSCKIRSKEEIELRKKLKISRAKINKKFKKDLANLT